MMTDSGDLACPEAREDSQGQWGNAVPNRYPYLRYMLAEYIKQLCEENHLDLTLLKTKEDRIQALQMLPNLRDAGLNLNNSSREKPVETFNVKLKGFHVLTSDDDVECYLSTFERLCIKHNIPEANWTIILESFLTGKAQRAYFALTENEKEDYQLVKESVLYAYQLTPSTYREKFRNASKNSSETFRQFSSRLFLYLRRWLNPSDDLLSSKEFVVMMDKLIGDQLISSLKDENLKLKLLEQKWNTLADLADVADNLILARAACRSKSYDTRPKVSGASTQLDGNVRAPQSNIGSQVTQEPVTSRQRRSASRSDVTSLRCYRCNQVGHVSYNCPNNPQEDVINFVRISDPTHQEELHAVVDMVNPKEENLQYNCKPKGAYFETLIDGEASLAYADSGAGVSLISTSLVRTRVVKPLEQPICLSLLDGTPFVVAGKTTCTLEVAGERDQVEFLVSDIPCDILMGRDLLVKFALVFDLRDGSYWSEGHQPKVKFPLVWVGAKDGTCGKKDSLKKDEKVGEEPDPLEDYGITKPFGFLVLQAGEAYIITDLKPQNQFVWMSEFVEAMGYSMPRIVIPVWFILTIALIGEFIYKILKPLVEVQVFLSRTELYQVCVTHHYKPDKARKQLGFVAVERNLEDIVEYYRARGHQRKKPSSWVPSWVINIFIGLLFAVVLISFLPTTQ
ncbi:Short-chain dehydrogenase/reductase family 42E member 1 [Holothuria leucospilota]|uniref:Short-chain dehydrogenase/reductase family 42E member 1 n=1 Tax=Holothuria leucospilota TaxID=206669 RepID=A0A9Q1C1D9_HOLLE|nr:Short-chain dehydrogenase/reductase family 42E member 1 [Holothuria leucospilota]